METTFTSDELATLIQALEAWKGQPAMSGLMADLMAAVLLPDTRKREEAAAASKAKREPELARRDEVATMLKAKLITMRDKAAINDLTK